MAAPTPAAAPAGEFEEEEEDEELRSLNDVVCGRRVLHAGCGGGVVTAVERSLDYTFLFNVSFDDGTDGYQLECHELDAAVDAAMAAAQQVRLQPLRHAMEEGGLEPALIVLPLGAVSRLRTAAPEAVLDHMHILQQVRAVRPQPALSTLA